MATRSRADARRGALLFTGATLLYFGLTTFFAGRKLLWFDELFTVLIAQQPDWTTFQSAMTSGGDLLPPGIHMITRGAIALFGAHHATFRLPAMIGFWLMLLGVYAFVRHRCSSAAAWSAVLLPMATAAYWYGFEARPYGVLAAAAAWALVAWQRVDGPHRTPWLVVLTAACASALLLHWHGVIVLGIVGVAEVSRLGAQQRVRFGVLASLSAAGLLCTPILYPFFRHSLEFRGIIGPPDVITFVANGYEVVLGGVAPFLLALFVIAAISRREPPSSDLGIPSAEIVAAAAFAALPVLSALLAWTTQTQALPRYAMPGVLGCGVLVGYIAERTVAGRRGMLPWFAVLVAAVASNLVVQKLHLPDRRVVSEQRQDFALLKEAGDAASPTRLVIPDGLSFIRLAYYAEPATARRLIHARDPRILGSRALGELAAFAPLTVVDPNAIDLHDWVGAYDIGFESPLLATLAQRRLELRGLRAADPQSPYWNLLEMRAAGVEQATER